MDVINVLLPPGSPGLNLHAKSKNHSVIWLKQIGKAKQGNQVPPGRRGGQDAVLWCGAAAAAQW